MKLIDEIKKHEGFRDRVYKCTAGVDTIGYGFAIKDLVLDQDIADIILQRKLNQLIKRIKRTFTWYDRIPEEAQHVVVNMCFQLGIGGVSKFKKTLSHFKNHKWQEASVEMLDSKWARQTPNRALELSNIIKSL